MPVALVHEAYDSHSDRAVSLEPHFCWGCSMIGNLAGGWGVRVCALTCSEGQAGHGWRVGRRGKAAERQQHLQLSEVLTVRSKSWTGMAHCLAEPLAVLGEHVRRG